MFVCFSSEPVPASDYYDIELLKTLAGVVLFFVRNYCTGLSKWLIDTTEATATQVRT